MQVQRCQPDELDEADEHKSLQLVQWENRVDQCAPLLLELLQQIVQHRVQYS